MTLSSPSTLSRPAAALLAAAGLCLLLPGTARAANLFVNASFETPTLSYEELAGGSTAISGWTTVLSGVEHFSAPTRGVGAAADGVMVVDLANFTFTGGGGIEQVVPTVAGERYDLSFYAGNSLSSGRDGTGIVKVTLNGSTTYSFSTATATGAPLAWTLRSLSFVASGANTTVRFWNDQDPLLHFAAIDGVGMQLSAVPEAPTGPALLAGLAAVGWCWRRRRL